eukprot:183838_1
MTFSSFWTFSITLPLGLVGCLIVITLQLISDKYSSSKTSDNYTKILLYCIYSTALLCGIFGYSLHLSTDVSWCKIYGMPPCFILLGACKSFLYLFFIHRAKLSQGITISNTLHIVLKYIAPAYILIYYILYCTLAPTVFSGKIVANTNHAISNCVFDTWQLWFIIFACSVDMFNTISSLCLFIHPLLTVIHQINSTKDIENNAHVDNNNFMTVMKWNITLSVVANISSVTTLIMIPFANHYIWAFCLADPMLNAICVFCMIAPNRKLIQTIYNKIKCNNNKEMNLKVTKIVVKRTSNSGMSENTTPETKGEVIVNANDTPKYDEKTENNKKSNHSNSLSNCKLEFTATDSTPL